MIERCANKAGHLSLMRNLVRDMWAFKVDEKKELAHQRGKGIGLKTPMRWPVNDNGSEGTNCSYYCPPEASLPTNCHNKQLVSSCSWQGYSSIQACSESEESLPIGYSSVKKPKKTSVRKGNHALGAQAKQSSGDQNPCAPINGMAKTYAQAVAYLPPVVKSQAYKPLWKRDPDYNAWFNRPGWLKPAHKCVDLALQPASVSTALSIDDQTGMVTPQTQCFVNEQQQAPDEGLDSYEDATDQNAFTDAAQQDLAESLGINKTESQASSTRTVKGFFKKSDKCVFCPGNVTEEEGYAHLNCGHKAHFDKAYYDCYVGAPYKSCTSGACKKKKAKNVKCKECHKNLGHGIFETGCYCSTMAPQIHADELET
uniref:Nanos-type domain-containing protein n=1 Tax=Globodera pallida TaxID=36090 RepID=A0A183CQ88_GLOPA